MAKKSIGLKSIFMGSVAADGGMGTALSDVPATVSDTASITTEEGSKTDFKIEQSDAPFYFIESDPGKQVVAWSFYDVSLDTIARFFGGTVGSTANAIATLGTLVGGSLYTNGTYYNVPLTGGTGSGARATIVVSGGAVTAVTITYPGTGYTVADSLTAAATDIGGTGSGFTQAVLTVGTGVKAWDMPATLPAVERSVQIITKDLWTINIPRLSITAKLQWNLQKTKLAQVDVSGAILDPEKAGVAKAQFIEPVAS